MKSLLGLAVAMCICASPAIAEELKSGLQEGEGLGAFYVTKVTGAEDDGVPVNENLCYRCKNGSRPQVIVFTRSTDEKVVSLLKKLDAEVANKEDAQLRAFVNMLGGSKDAATDQVKKLATATKAKNIPFVVPNENENGPDNYGINPKAELTIIFATESKVVANLSYAKASELDVDAALKAVEKVL